MSSNDNTTPRPGGLLTRQTAKLNADDPTPHVDYSYDALGQLTRVDAPDVSYDYSYDNAQRLQTVTNIRPSAGSGQAKTLTCRQNPGGLLDSHKDSDGQRQDYL